MTGLKNLPDFSIQDRTSCRFPKCQRLECVNGFLFPKLDAKLFCTKKASNDDQVGYLQREDMCSYDPLLTYGRTKSKPLPQFQPWYVLYSNKCLTYRAFFKQGVHNSPDEHYRIRIVNIIYYLEDDSILVMEPKIDNAGFPQGRYLKRTKHVPKNDLGEFWHWKDFNIGIDVAFYGTVFHIINADLFTKEFMASQGIDVNPTEDEPPDPYVQNRLMANTIKTNTTPLVDDKERRRLEFDGKVLRFSCVWDDRESEYGGVWEHGISYFLEDDTISIKEIHKRNDGKEPFQQMLRRTKVPKNLMDRPSTYPACYLELSDAEVTEYYAPKDLIVGETIFIFGRRFLLTDCDFFTRQYYGKMLGIEQPPGVTWEQRKTESNNQIEVKRQNNIENNVPPSFTKKPPTDNVICQLTNQNNILRYTAKLVSSHPEDQIREFVVFYYLSDGNMKIMEPPIRNSGIRGGKFLTKCLVSKPKSALDHLENYTPADFYIGAQIHVNKHTFVITGADLRVYYYMKSNTEKFDTKIQNNLRDYIFQHGYLKGEIEEELEKENEKHRFDEFKQNLKEPEKRINELEKCIGELVAKSDVPPQVEKKTGDYFQVERKENLDKEPDQVYGITPVVKDARYYNSDKLALPSTECEHVRDAPHIPCCLQPDCPDYLNVKDMEESREAYYQSFAQKHKEVCDASEDYYSQKCKDEHVGNKKTVTFDNDSVDRCAFMIKEKTCNAK